MPPSDYKGITQFPDQILRLRCPDVEFFDATLRGQIQQAVVASRKTGRAGVAAPQIGILKRFFVANLKQYRHKVFVNPKIIYSSGAQIENEGCLSLPHRHFALERPDFVTVEASDESGTPFALSLSGFDARIICHEMDHMDGCLVIDRAVDQAATLPRQQRRAMERELQKINQKKVA